MTITVFTVLGAAVMMTAYAFGLAGPVCGILFLGGVFNGALIHYARPLIEWATKP